MSRRLWFSVPAVAAFCALLLVVVEIKTRAVDPSTKPQVNSLPSLVADQGNGGGPVGIPQSAFAHIQTIGDTNAQIHGTKTTVQIDYKLSGAIDKGRLKRTVNDLNAQGSRLSDTIRKNINGGVIGKPLNKAPSPWVDFHGTISVTDTGLRVSIPRGEVNAAISWWGRIIAQAVGVMSLLAIRTACYAFFNVGSALAGPACASLASFSGAMVYQGIVIFVDGKQSDPAQWGQAIAGAMVAALGSAAWEGGINKFAKESMRPLYERFSAWLLETAGRIGGYIGEAVTDVGNYLRQVSRSIYAAMERAFTAAGVQGSAPNKPGDTNKPGSTGNRAQPRLTDQNAPRTPSSGTLKPFISRTSTQSRTLVVVPATDQSAELTETEFWPSLERLALAA